jgi:hypothetical protein
MARASQRRRQRPKNPTALLEGIYWSVRGLLLASVWTLAGFVALALSAPPIVIVGIAIGFFITLVVSLEKAQAAAFQTDTEHLSSGDERSLPPNAVR